jgi:hypothetical protein
MAGPSWLRWVLAAGFLGVAGYCVVRLVAARRIRYLGCHRALDVAHLIMGLGMAVMVSPVGGPVPAAGWQTAFVLIAAWFLGASWRQWRTGVVPEPMGWHGGNLHHAAAALAMVYMLSAMPGDGHHMAHSWMAAMPAPSGFSALGWLLAAYFIGSAVLLGPRALAAPPAPTLTPRVAAGCQIVMALGTGYLVAPVP